MRKRIILITIAIFLAFAIIVSAITIFNTYRRMPNTFNDTLELDFCANDANVYAYDGVYEFCDTDASATFNPNFFYNTIEQTSLGEIENATFGVYFNCTNGGAGSNLWNISYGFASTGGACEGVTWIQITNNQIDTCPFAFKWANVSNTTPVTWTNVNNTCFMIQGDKIGGGDDKELYIDGYHVDVNYSNVDNFPQWSAESVNPASPVEYTPSATYVFQIDWTDESLDPFGMRLEWTNSSGSYNLTEGISNPFGDTYQKTLIDLAANASGYTYKWYANDTYNQWNNTSSLTYIITKNDSGIMRLWLNGSEGNVSYATNSVANFTALLNLSSKTINLTSNYTGWVEITNATSVIYNTTTLATEGDFWNLTAYWTGDENYTAHSQYYYFNVTSVVGDSAFSVAFPTAYANETVTGTTKLTATELATWISFNFTEAEQNWVEPWANGSASLPQAGPTQPIFIIYLTGNQNSNFTVNMSTPSGIAVCVNASCAAPDCEDEQGTCTAINDNYVKLGQINAGKAMNVTFYGNVSKTASPGTYDSGPLWINNTKA